MNFNSEESDVKLNKFSLLAAAMLASIVGTTPAYAVVTPPPPIPITFENIAPGDVISISITAPGLTQSPPIISAPSIYVAAGNMQTITTDPATFSGGVLLGLATNFPAQSFANGNNVYGTADFANTDQGLKSSLSIVANNTTTNNVSFALFNGETFTQNYRIFADYNIGTNNFTGFFDTGSILSNWQSGFKVVDVNAGAFGVTNTLFNINSISISAWNTDPTLNSSPAVFDFLIDSVMFNGGSLNSLPTPVTPPSYVPPLQNPESPIVVQAPEQLSTDQRAVIDYGTEIDRTKETHVTVLTDLKKGVQQFETVKINGVTKFVLDKQGNKIPKFELETEDFVLQAVPEPESYAMMLTGLGVMGFVARRRRKVS
jgi:hypothetical protein